MRVLLVIDPLDTLNRATETSLLLCEELLRRGGQVFIATLPDLYLTDRGPGVRARRLEAPLDVRHPAAEHTFGDFDLVLMRKDPPVDAAYIAATFVLEQAAHAVPVVNDPVALRTVNEKLLPLRFAEFVPPTLVSADVDRLVQFAGAHERTVLKPLTDCSGRGIQFVERDAAARVVPPYVRARPDGWVMAQRYIEGVRHGDKRILLLAGDPVGAVNRIPRSPDALANIHQGARVEATALSAREHAIVAAVKPLLLQRRLWLAGIDVIDGYLTEINVTSPSAARQINAVSGTRVEVPIVDFLERLAGSARR